MLLRLIQDHGSIRFGGHTGLSCLGGLLLFLLILVLSGPLQAQENLPAVIKRISPAVVAIETQRGQLRGLGTGFFINAAGHIVTNYHVLAGSDQARVKLRDGKRYPIVRILATNKAADLILVAADLPAGPKPFLEVSPRPPEVGEKVYAIGHPMGFEDTVSEGIVSAIRRVPPLGEVIQITTPISPGSSGGPVFNSQGRVIGVARATFRQGQNLNFAVPGKYVLQLKPDAPQPYQKFAAEWPRESLELAYQGRMLLQKKDYRRALRAFEGAIKAKPDFGEAYFGAGMAAAALGRPEKAREYLEQAAALLPNNPEVRYRLALVYHVLGQKEQAQEEYLRLQKLHPPLAARLRQQLSGDLPPRRP